MRDQAEFFVPFYGEAFQNWVKDIKTIPTGLGQCFASKACKTLLAKHLPKHVQLPELKTAAKQTQAEALSDWNSVRERYLEPSFRKHLHYLLLKPFGADAPVAEKRYA